MKEIEEKKRTYDGGEITEKNAVKKLIKRTGRKLTYWYVNPFGEKQNRFNEEIARTVSELEEKNKGTEQLHQELSTVQNACKALINEINALKLRAAINSNTIQRMQEEISDSYNQINEYLLEIKPEIRKSPVKSCTMELTSYGYSGLGEKITALKRSENNPQSAQNMLEEIGKCYLKGARNELELLNVRKQRSTIAVICVGLYGSVGMEAIRNEAYDLFMMLKCKSIYNVKLVSLEPDFTEIIEKNDIIYIPYEQNNEIRSCIMNMNPHLCVFCESTANILFINNASFLLFKSVVKLSGQNPLQKLNCETIEELCHLNDFGVHKYCVQSKAAYDIMVENGFKEPVVSYPVMNPEKALFKAQRKHFSKENTIIGFASSPMTEEQMEFRGMSLLADLMNLIPDVKFKVLWRNSSLPVPENIKNCSNCVIEYGMYDMQNFYSEIDILLIPYYSMDFNHACSMSAIEAMFNRIPVAATKISGISELVNYCGLGEISENNAESLADTVRFIIQNYETYDSDDKISMLKAYLSNINILKLIEDEMRKELPKGIITLHQWDMQLKQNGRYLVKGQESMKNYYSNQDVAGSYNARRFETYPENCFDLLERRSINVIIEDAFGSNTLDILDIACGDGRILQENLKYGRCTAVDSSEAMLDIIRTRFENNAALLNTLHKDFFTGEINGEFDIITTFRYIRHFEYSKRKQLYKKIQSKLKKGGLLIFDVPNIKFEIMQKNTHGWQSYNIYDVFWNKQDFIDEMTANGFEVKYIIPVGQGLIEHSSDFRIEPMTWTAAVTKAEA